MKIASTIVEYNPLHNGHLYSLKKIKETSNCDATLCIMSGNFVQRGEPALIDKWTRTEMALKSGVDLVIELPAAFALSSAEFFAFGAVSILNDLNCIDYLYFGSECGDIHALYEIAKILNNEDYTFKKILKNYLDKGLSYPLARDTTLIDYLNIKNINIDQSIIKSSNNILGIEYIKALIKLNSKIQPQTIKRIGQDYNSTKLQNDFASATGIRRALKECNDITTLKSYMPDSSFNIFKDLYDNNYKFVFADEIFNYIKFKVLTSKHLSFNIPDCNDGLDNRIIKALETSNSLEECINNIKTKRYTRTRICRILMQYFIGFEDFDIAYMRTQKPTYARVLGFNNKGIEVMREIKNKSDLNLIVKTPKNSIDELHLLDIQSTKAYSLLNKDIKPFNDFIKSPIKII